jgi:gentisate 1,2-dioxygenase
VATAAYGQRPELTPERRAFYERLERFGAAPLWEVMGTIIPPQPRPAAQPVLWKYDELRPLLLEAGRLLTEKEAERRVLILENPGLPGRSQATGSLYAGLQLILPGETARTHRHATSALRFVLEGTGAYTSVDGVRATMHPGDFIVTPSWRYHDHGNPGGDTTIWLDGLDIPIVNLFDTSFAEHHPQELAPPAPAGDSTTSVPFSFPYARTRDALEALRHEAVHPAHGCKLRYVDPVSGHSPMPTIAAFLQLLPKGFDGTATRQTDAAVYVGVEGHGRTQVGDRTFDWGPRDVFVAPSWMPVRHHAPSADAVLFSFSDRPAQQALGLWRELA